MRNNGTCKRWRTRTLYPMKEASQNPQSQYVPNRVPLTLAWKTTFRRHSTVIPSAHAQLGFPSDQYDCTSKNMVNWDLLRSPIRFLGIYRIFCDRPSVIEPWRQASHLVGPLMKVLVFFLDELSSKRVSRLRRLKQPFSPYHHHHHYLFPFYVTMLA